MSQPAIITKLPKARRRLALPYLNRNELIAASSLAAALAFVLAVAAPWPFPAALVLAASVLGVAVTRRHGLLLVGPLFFFDLVRLARRGRSTLLRCVYALVLFGGLWFTYSNRFPHIDVIGRAFDQGPTLPARKVNEFALEFVVAILVVQGAAALVLTPAYLAGAVAEEKERKSLALLFTTDLRDREIVLGKLFGRLTHLAGVLFTGLPILSLTQLLGGVDIRVVVSGFIVTGMTLLSAGGVSILCSVLCRRVLSAVLLSYGFVILFSSGCLCTPVHAASSPMAFMLELSRRLNLDHETELLGS
ncbi:MAG TPA: hypothetical protein VKI65_19845, partial [Gemmataceae bacterium]|nr:hypothetical protein [Gemmataceae bacterium]